MEFALISKVAVLLIWGTVVGLLAKRKNRNPWGWGLAGAFSWFIALLVLAFLPYRCPVCSGSLSNLEGKIKKCPKCGSFGAKDCTRVEPLPAQRAVNSAQSLNTQADEHLWSAALAEFENSSRRPGLWARVFAEADGNESVAKAAYLKTRVAELSDEPPVFITELRHKGYRVGFIDSRWQVVYPSGQSTTYFSSLKALEVEAPFLMGLVFKS
ncbi:MAG: hypothetical protein V4451_22270 [Pseudomonadota bacterium]